ncbi:MAG: Proline-rich region [Candidatus Burkholderia crenata]|nr:MAG: Proline-rich region [Candidatus Burkholderia crenata]
MKYPRLTLLVSMRVSLGILGGCAVVPTGPSVMALPGTGKTFDQFRADDGWCRQFAYGQVGGNQANQSTTNSVVGSAVVGTALGAAAGAAFNGGSGAGLLAGSLFGASNAQGSAYDVQRRYDQAYLQYMYANGNRVPMRGRMMSAPPPQDIYSTPPPPPPGYWSA